MSENTSLYLDLPEEMRGSFQVSVDIVGQPPNDCESTSGYLIYYCIYELLINVIENSLEETSPEDTNVKIVFEKNRVEIHDSYKYPDPETLTKTLSALSDIVDSFEALKSRSTNDELNNLSTKSDHRESLGGGLGLSGSVHNMKKVGGKIEFEEKDSGIITVLSFPDQPWNNLSEK